MRQKEKTMLTSSFLVWATGRTKKYLPIWEPSEKLILGKDLGAFSLRYENKISEKYPRRNMS